MSGWDYPTARKGKTMTLLDKLTQFYTADSLCYVIGRIDGDFLTADDIEYVVQCVDHGPDSGVAYITTVDGQSHIIVSR
jgi:hypothetical protein